MSKFSDYFCEPNYFSDGSWVIDAEYSKDEAAQMINEARGDPIEDDIDADALSKDYVRYGFPPEFVEDRELLQTPCWYTGANKGKGAKAVWVLK